jgi:arginine-tRNA-protein transferase
MVESILKGKTMINLNGCHSNDHRGSTCGYCKNKKQNPGECKYGLTSNKMSADDYQTLMDRGWRRCGTYFYKSDFAQSCC